MLSSARRSTLDARRSTRRLRPRRARRARVTVLRWLTERRRKRLLETPFPAAWTEILESNVAACKLLDDDERQRLRDLVQVFIAEKHWEGAGGLELTDEIKVTIAG